MITISRADYNDPATFDRMSQQLGAEFVRKVLGDIYTGLFTFTASKVAEPGTFQWTIACTFKPSSIEGQWEEAPKGARSQLYKFTGTRTLPADDGIHLAMTVFRKVSDFNIASDRQPSFIKRITDAEVEQGVIFMLRTGYWTNANTLVKGVTWSWESNERFTWRNLSFGSPSFPLGLFTTPPNEEGLAIRFIFTIWDVPFVKRPEFVPLVSRKPRKWGRALTERWEEEHKQLVNHRKFARNTKKMETDPNAKGFGRAGTGKPASQLMNTWRDRLAAQAKAAALERSLKAVEYAYKRHGKSIDRKAALKVVKVLTDRKKKADKKAAALARAAKKKR